MTQSDLMARSGARWCEKHQRWECNARKANHHASALRGMAKCKNCVGRSLDIAKVIGEANIATWSASAAVDIAPVEPSTAVMSQLQVAAMKADLYGELLRMQLEVEGLGGLVGLTYAAGRDGARVETGEQVRALQNLEMHWRDRVVKYAEAAHRMGIATAQVELAQGQAEIVVLSIRGALDDAGAELLPGIRAVIIDGFLRRLAGGVGGELEPGSGAGS